MSTRGYWREVPDGTRVTIGKVIAAVREGGYVNEHAAAFVKACKVSGGFVMTNTSPKRFFEFVDPNDVTY